MFAYRAGRSPRYYVICLVNSDRAASFDLPLQRTPDPVEYRLTHAACLAPYVPFDDFHRTSLTN